MPNLLLVALLVLGTIALIGLGVYAVVGFSNKLENDSRARANKDVGLMFWGASLKSGHSTEELPSNPKSPKE